MTLYELTNYGYEKIENILPDDFQEENVLFVIKKDNELRIDYEFLKTPFDVCRSVFSILLQDINDNIPCGTLFVSVPVGEKTDTIIYIVRFTEQEFKKIKNFP